MVPASGLCLVPVDLVSGFFPWLQSLAVPEETGTFFCCPRFLTEGQVEMCCKALQGQNPCRGMVVHAHNLSPQVQAGGQILEWSLVGHQTRLPENLFSKRQEKESKTNKIPNQTKNKARERTLSSGDLSLSSGSIFRKRAPTPKSHPLNSFRECTPGHINKYLKRKGVEVGSKELQRWLSS